jgi:hypothetical protein
MTRLKTKNSQIKKEFIMSTNTRHLTRIMRLLCALTLYLVLPGLAGCGPSTDTPSQAQWFVSPLGDDGNDCHTPLAPCRTIGEALERAVDGDTIYLAEGTYNESLSVTKSVKITGELAAAEAMIDGTGITQSLVNVNCWACTVDVTLAHLTIQNGTADTGGGLAMANANVTMQNVLVRANHASQGGGGIVIQAGSTLTIENSFIEQNEAAGSSQYSGGGGIYNWGSLVMNNVIVQSNQARDLGGGLNNQGEATLTGVTFTGNETRGQAGGGAIYNAGTLTIHSGAFQQNQATQNGDGGAITNAGTATLNGLLASYNTAGSNGGALANLNTGTLNLTGSTLSNNTAAMGGGLSNNGGHAVLSGVTIDHNTVQYSGGGVMNNNAAVMNLSNVTISANSAEDLGGGIGNGGADATLFASNVTIAYNTSKNSLSHAPANGAGIYHLGGTASFVNVLLAYNQGANCGGLAFVASGLNLSSDASCNFDGYGNLINTDPLLAPLADNGGATLTHALQSGSQAIDAGTGWLAPPVDQRGVDRPVDGNMDGILRTDIGAFEFAPMTMSGQSTTPIITPTFLPLTFTLLEPANCRTGPGAVYPAVDSIPAGTALTAQGRDTNLIWIQVRAGRDTLCWIRANLGRLNSDPAWLPIPDILPTPTPLLPSPTDTPLPPPVCSAYTTLETCQAHGCTWFDGVCRNP